MAQLETHFDFSLYSRHFSLLSLTSLLSASEREVTSPSDFKVVGALSPGANINCYDNRRQSPLFVASMSGHCDVVECLLSSGADINLRDN